MKTAALKIILSAVAVAFLFSGFLFSHSEETKIEMKTHNDQSCIKCHKKKTIKKLLRTGKHFCSQYCAGCHNTENHHPVNIKLNDDDSEFYLTADNTISCITCHDMSKNRFDDKSWVSTSLFDTVFGSQDKYRTFYLIKRNNEGQLCKSCH